MGFSVRKASQLTPFLVVLLRDSTHLRLRPLQESIWRILYAKHVGAFQARNIPPSYQAFQVCTSKIRRCKNNLVNLGSLKIGAP